MAIPQNVAQWQSLAVQAGQKYGVDPALILAVIQQESGGDPNAGSNADAHGLMQLLPSTAAAYGVSGSQITNPVMNIDAGTHYLSDLIKAAHGDLTIALGHYYGSATQFPPGTNSTYPSQVLAKYNAIKGQVILVIGTIATDILNALKKFYSAPITQGFGPTDLAIEPAYAGSAHYHEGIDLGIASGTNLPSIANGTVTKVVTNSPGVGFGNYLVVTLSNGITVLYGHLKSVSVAQGDKVSIGQTLGLTDSTGASTGPHLHIQMQDPSQVSSNNPLGLISPMPYITGAITGNIQGDTNSGNTATGTPAFDPTQWPIVGGIGSAMGGIINGIKDQNGAIMSLVKVILNGFSYITDPDKRPILLMAVLGGGITLFALRKMIEGSPNAQYATTPYRMAKKNITAQPKQKKSIVKKVETVAKVAAIA